MMSIDAQHICYAFVPPKTKMINETSIFSFFKENARSQNPLVYKTNNRWKNRKD
jgi:hypothetical protein